VYSIHATQTELHDDVTREIHCTVTRKKYVASYVGADRKARKLLVSDLINDLQIQ